MAVPTAQQPGTSEQRPLASKLVMWVRKLGTSLGRPLFAVILAMIAGAIVIMITWSNPQVDRFTGAVNAYSALYSGSFGSLLSLSYTLVGVTPLILAGLSVAIAFRAGLFNIGAAGQLTVGAMTAGIIAFKLPTAPGWLLIPTMIIGSMLAGALWGGIVGILKAWRGAHEVVTTIMLNWIAFFVADYLINGPFKSPSEANQSDSLPLQATLPLVSKFYNSTLGTFLPKISGPEAYLVDVGIFFALFALVVYWFIVSRTTFGYEIRVIGQNQKAARYAGIPIKRNIFLVMAIAGAFAGLAGALRLMGQFPYTLISNTFSIDTTGFDAIGVALLGRTTAIGALLGALLFAGLRQGGTIMQLKAHVSGDLVFIIQALMLFSIAAQFLPVIQRRLPTWMTFSRKPPLVPAISGATITNLPKSSESDGAEQEAFVTENTRDGPTETAVSPAENDPTQSITTIEDSPDQIAGS